MVLGAMMNVIHRGPTSGSPAAVKSLRERWKSRAGSVKAKPRICPPKKRQWCWLTRWRRCLRRVWRTAIRKLRLINQQVKATPWPQPNLEQAATFFEGAAYFLTLDFLYGFWQMPMDDEGDKLQEPPKARRNVSETNEYIFECRLTSPRELDLCLRMIMCCLSCLRSLCSTNVTYQCERWKTGSNLNPHTYGGLCHGHPGEE